MSRAGSLNYLVLPTSTAIDANKTWIFKLNGSGEPGKTLETPAGSVAEVILQCQ